MKKIANLVLGIVTSIGGFVEVGSISTAAQAGAEFRFQLLWAIALAGLTLAMLIEMSGRLASVSKQTVAAAVRERFGIHFQSVPLVAELIIDTLLLTAEIGGVAIALRLLTGVGFQWWVVPVVVVVWLALWLSNFAIIEDGFGVLGLITLSFVVAAWTLGPDRGALLRGLVPTVPDHHLTRYGFLAVSIVGATISPYLLNFYASGAVEERWTEPELWVNRTTSFIGMGFGSVVSMGVLVTSALVLAPKQIQVESYEQAALMFLPPFGSWGVTLFALALAAGCLGAAVELGLNAGNLVSQAFGWPWGANKERRETARFSLTFTAILLLAMLISLTGFDPLRLTLICVALTVVIMPLIVLPFLVLMNDDRLVKTHTSGPIGNGLLAALTILGAVLALVVIPLEILGG
jgi:Mn2+/Fe2+ NRAMP family transporter